MVENAKRLSKRSLILLIGAFVILLISIVLEITAPASPDLGHGVWSQHTLSEFLREVAFAMGIAFALIATVELESRRELSDQVASDLNRIKESVFNATFRRSFPEEILSEIEHLVFRQNFVRTDYTTHYVLTPVKIPAANGHAPLDVIRCVSTTSYKVRNITYAPQIFTVTLSGEKPAFPEIHDHVAVELLKVKINGKPVEICSFSVENQDMVIKGSYEVGAIPPQGIVEVETRLTVLKLRNDYETWRCVYPTTRVNITVRYPDDTFKWSAHALHRSPLLKQQIDSKTEAYHLEYALLPQQGIHFWWCCDRPHTHIRSAAVQHTPNGSVSQPVRPGTDASI